MGAVTVGQGGRGRLAAGVRAGQAAPREHYSLG